MPKDGRVQMQWSDWLYGLFSGAISGGASAVIAGVSVSLIDPKDWAVGTVKFFELVFSVFVSSGLLAGLNFMASHPLPSRTQTVTTVQAVEQKGDTVVTTKIQETKTE